MKNIITATAVIALLGAPSIALGQAKGQPSENASPMGIERATRNSDGGDREHGGFGPDQSEFVQQNSPYGQWLKENGWTAGGTD